jgi:hypothetical protein
MKVITETYLMKVITEMYLMKVITETYLMKVITKTYLMKVITNTYLMKFITLALILSNLSIQYKNFHWANTTTTSPIRIFPVLARFRSELDRNPLDVSTIARKSPERCQSSAEVENGETQTKQRVEKL